MQKPEATITAPSVRSPEPSAFSFLLLGALQKRPMYEGTVPAAVVADRRRRKRVARKSRRTNRKARQ